MKQHEGQKSYQPVNVMFHTACISILSFFILCGPGYGSTEIPVNVNTATADIEAATGSDLNSPVNSTTVKADFGSAAASAFDPEFNNDEAVDAETLLYAGTAGRAKHIVRSACKESCSL
jgi:hypothetical protein